MKACIGAHHPERSDLIDGSIGQGPLFQRSCGYYAHGVSETTAILPRDWRDRLILVALPGGAPGVTMPAASVESQPT